MIYEIRYSDRSTLMLVQKVVVSVSFTQPFLILRRLLWIKSYNNI